MKSYDLFWAPEGKRIQRVRAKTARAAIRKVAQTYRQYLGEVYAVEVTDTQEGSRERDVSKATHISSH